MTVAEPSTGFSLEDGPLRPGVRAGSYLIERRLGSGGMGAVYAATHIGLDKPVALKALHRTFAVQEKSVKRFVREGRAASRIRHPHVVDVTDVGTHDGIPFLVMEMLDGEDLEEHLDRCGSLPLPRLAAIMLPVIDAVATAHDAGVIHRDLKPSNIFLARDGRGEEIPKVLDFGIARMLHEQGTDRIRLTQQGAFVGTPYYASPEQATNGSAADARSDQYSIGAILYQLASGELPVKGKTPFEVLTAIVCGEITPFHTLRDTWHPGLVQLVERSMRFDPNERYPDLRELGRALLALADDETYARFRAAFGAPRDRSMAHEDTRLRTVAEPTGSFADPQTPALAQLHALAAPTPPGPSGVLPETRAAMPRVEGPAPSIISPAVATAIAPAKRTGRGPALFLALSVLALLVAGGTSYWIYTNRTAAAGPVSSAPETVLLRVTPATATIELDGEPVGVGSAALPADGRAHRLRVTAEGFETVERDIEAGQSPTAIALVANPAETEPEEVAAGIGADDSGDSSEQTAGASAEGSTPEDSTPSSEPAATEAAPPPVAEVATPTPAPRPAVTNPRGRRRAQARLRTPRTPVRQPVNRAPLGRSRPPIRPVTTTRPRVGANNSPVLR